MLYERVSRRAVGEVWWQTALIPPGPCRIGEPTMRYRRQVRARKRDPADSLLSAEIERRVRERDQGARWRRIAAHNRRISEALTGELKTTWLSLEEAIHDHWLDVALEHYEAGLEAGSARALATQLESSAPEVRARLRAIAEALSRLIAELED